VVSKIYSYIINRFVQPSWLSILAKASTIRFAHIENAHDS